MGRNTKNKTTPITNYINKFFKQQNLNIDKDVLDEDIIKKTMVELIIEKNISLSELSNILQTSSLVIDAFKNKSYSKHHTLICIVLIMVKITKNDIYEKLLNDCKYSEELNSQTINEIENMFGDQKILECISRSHQYSISTFDDESNFQDIEQEVTIEKMSRDNSIKDVCNVIEEHYPTPNV